VRLAGQRVRCCTHWVGVRGHCVITVFSGQKVAASRIHWVGVPGQVVCWAGHWVTCWGKMLGRTSLIARIIRTISAPLGALGSSM